MFQPSVVAVVDEVYSRVHIFILHFGVGGDVGAPLLRIVSLMSGHIHSGASSPECELVRALVYDTPRLLDYSPGRVYRECAPLGTWPPTQRDYDLCEHNY